MCIPEPEALHMYDTCNIYVCIYIYTHMYMHGTRKPQMPLVYIYIYYVYLHVFVLIMCIFPIAKFAQTHRPCRFCLSSSEASGSSSSRPIRRSWMQRWPSSRIWSSQAAMAESGIGGRIGHENHMRFIREINNQKKGKDLMMGYLSGI